MVPLKQYLRDVERTYILSVLRTSGNPYRAASHLGVPRTTLMSRMRALQIDGAAREFKVEPLPRVSYRVRFRRLDGSWTIGTCPLNDLPLRDVDRWIHDGEAQLVMVQESRPLEA